MNASHPRGLFLTGTDTDIGKTVVAAWLMSGLGMDYWKPVQSGLEGETDTEAVRRLTGLPDERFHSSAFETRTPASPHLSARLDGVEIRMNSFLLPDSPRPVLVEGAGGLLVPLNDDALMIDLIVQLGLPVVLVARSGLGTINHTLLSVEALRSRNLPLVGVVMNGLPNEPNREAVETYGRVPVIGQLPHMDDLSADSLAAMTPPYIPGFEMILS
jgi:dethiobiotin synthetase